MRIELHPAQRKAVYKLNNGNILCGDVGSGKSRTSLSYYYKEYGGDLDSETYTKMSAPPDLYIVTTARKRDTLEWEGEMKLFLLSTHPELNLYKNKVVVDSWNNIKKYSDVKDAFFIFDEQRVVGYGTWSKTFIKISKSNKWILLSATPGDTWSDYIPVFIANGFYRNKTQFNQEHVIFAPNRNFPQIQGYVGRRKLESLRDSILVNIPMSRKTELKHNYIYCNYDSTLYKKTGRLRVDPYDNDLPIENATALFYIWRRICNSDETRLKELLLLTMVHKKVIIFYNFNYELDLLRDLFGTRKELKDYKFAEWNGQKHEQLPEGKKWAYVVQYAAGAEGWNCITTDTVIFYSQNYSYRTTAQASGRINRMNTPYKELYYYHLLSKSPIDKAILQALKEKRNFNESSFAL